MKFGIINNVFLLTNYFHCDCSLFVEKSLIDVLTCHYINLIIHEYIKIMY